MLGAFRRPGPAAILVAAGLALTGCSSSHARSVPSGVAGDASAAVASPVATVSAAGVRAKAGAGGAVMVGTTSVVAQAKVASLPVYRTQKDTKPFLTLKNSLPSQAPLVLLVSSRESSMLEVLLPVRPNGSQGWVKASDVTLYQHPYRITVSVSRHELVLYKGSSVVLHEKVGLGTSTTPTPGGVFYTRELLRPKDPKGPYGPYAYGLSGHSEVLDQFLGGDGEIGLHGTNDPAGLGRDVSHGCIRMSNAAITRLATTLPLGVPVLIIA